MAQLPLDQLQAETFTAHLGSEFQLAIGSISLPLVLTEAKTAGAARPGGSRTPFGLTFRCPGPQLLPQAIYRLEHPVLGVLEIFLVPVGRDGDGFFYQAIFN